MVEYGFVSMSIIKKNLWITIVNYRQALRRRAAGGKVIPVHGKLRSNMVNYGFVSMSIIKINP